MPRFCILRRWWGCGRARKKIVRENLVICGVVERVSCFFRFGSFCLSWTFSSEWSKCSRRTRTLWGQRLSGIPVLECIFWRGTVVGVTAAVRSQKVAAMVCDQTLCFVQRVYLHIPLLLLLIHLQIGGFSCLNTSCIFFIEWQKSELLFL
jgi:hypothetical protein